MSQTQDSLPPFVIVTGPTASGKSDLAVMLAEQFSGEIIGADSRQIYIGMDVATAKPSSEQRRIVPHHLVDIVRPNQGFDAADWLAAARGAIEATVGRGRLPIVCGGTGLYLRALLDGLFAGPPADQQLRARLLAEEAATAGALVERLRACDPVTAEKLHPNDHVRLVRAIEVFELTAKPISVWHAESAKRGAQEVLVLGVDRDRDELNSRIEQRADEMTRAGLVEEVRALRETYPGQPRAFSAIGYHEAGQVIDGRLEAAELAAAIAQATRRYAKRQRTWVRGRTEAVRIDPEAGPSATAALADFVAKQGGLG